MGDTMAKKIDMTGWVMKEHGVPNSRLIVLTENKNRSVPGSIYWDCLCECGTKKTYDGKSIRSGHTLSCGCYKRDLLKHQADKDNLIGKKFNKLTVIKQIENPNKSTGRMWLCQCECGNFTRALTRDLNNGKMKSCGCWRKEQASLIHRVEITGQRFGKLVVIKYIDSIKSGGSFRRRYLCQCDCGNQTIVSTTDLLSGATRSCGCLKSRGQEKINTILSINHIPYQIEYTYPDLLGEKNRHLRFDFWVNNEFLLEYDGKQHFNPTGGWGEGDKYIKIQKNDQRKNEYAKSHNIPLKRIPYWDYDKITLENIMSDKWLID